MNGIDKITAKLEAEALADVEAIKAEAAGKCDEIKKEFEKKAQDEYWKRVQAGTKDCENRVQRLASASDMEAKKAILAFKQEMVTAAFNRAVEKLCTMPKEQYVAFLAGVAAKAAESGREELIFNEKDRREVGEAAVKAANELLCSRGLDGQLTLADETREMAGGLVLRQGNIEVNCAADTLVQLERNALSSQVAEILFA